MSRQEYRTMSVDPSPPLSEEAGRLVHHVEQYYAYKISHDDLLEIVRIAYEDTTEQLAQLSDGGRIAAYLINRGVLSAMFAAQILEDPEELHIGEYILLEEIDSGGMGVIYRVAKKQGGSVHLALKVCKQPMDRLPREQAFRFMREGFCPQHIKGKRMDAHVVPVQTVHIPGVCEEQDARCGRDPFYVMGLVKGSQTMVKELEQRGKSYPAEQALQILQQVAQALRDTHEQGIVIRDLKPANLLVVGHGDKEQPVVYLADFGLAKVQKTSDNMELIRTFQQHGIPINGDEDTGHATTEEGVVAGTHSFMAPEQYGNFKKADQRADIYALGTTLAFLMTGEDPPKNQHANSAWIAELSVPEPIRVLIRRFCAQEQSDRPQTAQEAMEAIRQTLVALASPEVAHRQLAIRNSIKWLLGGNGEKKERRSFLQRVNVPATWIAAFGAALLAVTGLMMKKHDVLSSSVDGPVAAGVLDHDGTSVAEPGSASPEPKPEAAKEDGRKPEKKTNEKVGDWRTGTNSFEPFEMSEMRLRNL